MLEGYRRYDRGAENERGRRFVVAGAAILAIAMGVGRFAYTPILPIMERDAGLTVTMAGLLASANLIGYFAGALLTMTRFARRRRLSMVRWGVGTVIVTTAAMAWTPMLWLPLRFVTGVSSGFVLIFASSIMLDAAATAGRRDWPPLFFSGVGIGIAFTGLASAPLGALGGSRAAWMGLAFAAALLLLATGRWFTDGTPAIVPEPPRCRSDTERDGSAFAWLIAVYTAEAFAYIIPATFLVAMVSAVPALLPYAAASWIVVGCAAATCTVLWGLVAQRIGKRNALVAALIVQCLGFATPALVPSAFGVICGALALGSTLIAITGFCTALAREMFPAKSSTAIGRLTVFYSVGQIAGPFAATALALRSGSYGAALLCASFIAAVAAMVAYFNVSEARPICS